MSYTKPQVSANRSMSTAFRTYQSAFGHGGGGSANHPVSALSYFLAPMML